MIKLTKKSEPKILTDNKKAWIDQLRDLQNQNKQVPTSVSNRYNHPDIKDSLRLECLSKCMYCESKIEHISDLHIEHIKPKAKDKFPDLTFEYENLGLSCPICNRNKSDTFDELVPFINPYVDDPESHFTILGAFIFANPADKRAMLTENEIELNRPLLLEARYERIKTIRSLIEIYTAEKNDTVKKSIKKQILKEVETDKVFSSCCKVFVDSML